VKYEREGRCSALPFATWFWYCLGFNNMAAEGTLPFGVDEEVMVCCFFFPTTVG
jgi:hypothetical protein